MDSAGSLSYESYYGLTEHPFSLTPDPRFLYKSAPHSAAFETLLSAIRRRDGVVVVTGDIGAGKTTLCRAVLQQLDRKAFTALVPQTIESRDDLFKFLLVHYGLIPIEDVKSGRLDGSARPELSVPVYEFLKSLGVMGAYAVIVIDEAQRLSQPLLEEIRVFSDFTDKEGREKLIQVVLVGQPELSTQLDTAEMRALKQRVTFHCQVEALDSAAVGSYIAHRLAVAGAPADGVAFTPEAITHVHKASKGVPRLINRTCDRSLRLGCERQVKKIDATIVADALKEAASPQPIADIPAYHRPDDPTERDLQALLKIETSSIVDPAPVPPIVETAPLPPIEKPAPIVIEKPRRPAASAPPPSSGRIVAQEISGNAFSTTRVAVAALIIMMVAGASVWGMNLWQRGPNAAAIPPVPTRPHRPLAPGFIAPQPRDSIVGGSEGLLAYVIEITLPTRRQTEFLSTALRDAGYNPVPPAVTTDRPAGRLVIASYASAAEAEADRQKILTQYPPAARTSQVVRVPQ